MPCLHPEDLWNANIVSLINLTNAIDWSSVRGAVHIGTTAEYGNTETPFYENQSLHPTNAYGWSKAASTQYAIMMTEAGYAKWCVARQFTGYGPGHTTGFIVDLTRALKRNETFIVNSSYVTRDLIFVDDTIEGLIRLAQCIKAVGEVVNLCSGKEISIGEIAKMVHLIVGMGRIELAQKEPRKGDFLRSWGSTKKMEQLTGWKSRISLEEGLEITVPTISE
jgi:dTDP-glucose 4,6-dehydratase